jgi:hypothetical protein
MIVALPGSAGTASEVALALCYRKPIIAWLRSRNDVPDLPAGVPVARSLDEVKDFVTTTTTNLVGQRPDRTSPSQAAPVVGNHRGGRGLGFGPSQEAGSRE